MLYCQYCNKKCKNLNSLRQHEIRCKQNPNRIDLSYIKLRDSKGHKGSNQYIKAKLENRIIQISDLTKYKIGNGWRNKKHTQEQKNKISLGIRKAIQEHPESYSSTNINGRVKHYIYKNVKLDGLWELKVAKYLDSKNIKWIRANKGIEYFWKDKIHLYFPDFYLIKYDYYIEVKGYQTERDICKWKNIKNLIIIKQKEIKEIDLNIYNILEFIK